jgi:hypothetical protein
MQLLVKAGKRFGVTYFDFASASVFVCLGCISTFCCLSSVTIQRRKKQSHLFSIQLFISKHTHSSLQISRETGRCFLLISPIHIFVSYFCSYVCHGHCRCLSCQLDEISQMPLTVWWNQAMRYLCCERYVCCPYSCCCPSYNDTTTFALAAPKIRTVCDKVGNAR